MVAVGSQKVRRRRRVYTTAIGLQWTELDVKMCADGKALGKVSHGHVG